MEARVFNSTNRKPKGSIMPGDSNYLSGIATTRPFRSPR